jgi:hypothetical protein
MARYTSLPEHHVTHPRDTRQAMVRLTLLRHPPSTTPTSSWAPSAKAVINDFNLNGGTPAQRAWALVTCWRSSGTLVGQLKGDLPRGEGGPGADGWLSHATTGASHIYTQIHEWAPCIFIPALLGAYAYMLTAHLPTKASTSTPQPKRHRLCAVPARRHGGPRGAARRTASWSEAPTSSHAGSAYCSAYHCAPRVSVCIHLVLISSEA